MGKQKTTHPTIPGLGLRSFKTALSMALLTLAYASLQRNPTLACIGAIVATGSSVEDSKTRGANRLVGTVIGGFIGFALSFLEHKIFPEGNNYMRAVLIFVGTMLIICLFVNLKWPGAVVLGVASFCIIIFSVSGNSIEYVMGRLIDTTVGVAFAIFVNSSLDRKIFEKRFGLKSNLSDEALGDGIESGDVVENVDFKSADEVPETVDGISERD